MKPDGGGHPSGVLLELIERDFGSYESMLKEFKHAALNQFGSGWVWLACMQTNRHMPNSNISFYDALIVCLSFHSEN